MRAYIPPVPHPATADLEGRGVLEEVSGELGEALWLTLRSATLWASLPQVGRDGLFKRRALRARRDEVLSGVTDRVPKEALSLLWSALARRDATTSADLARSCEAIADWAATANYWITQAEFLHAAALAAFEEPRRALMAGRATRDQGNFPVAEVWFHRAIAQARWRGDWDIYVRAHVGLGKLWFRRGRTAAATRYLEKAARAGIRRGQLVPAAMAYHDLFNLAFFSRRFDEGVELARKAASLYGRGHPDLPLLAWDIAFQWMERDEYSRAYPFLCSLRPAFAGRQAMVADGGIARAAGYLGLVAEYAQAAQRVRSAPDSLPNKAAVLLEVVRGAIALGDHEAASALLAEAERIATPLREARTLILLDELREEASRPMRGGVKPRLHPSPVPVDATLAREFVAML
jgi:tetratricopeptide (TPR) repeat protein